MTARSYTIQELADLIGGTVRGPSNVRITGVADVAEAGPNDATWVSNPKYARALTRSQAGVVLVPMDFGPTPIPAVLCDRIERAVASLLDAFAPAVPRPKPGVHPTAVVDDTARLGPDCSVGPHATIEADVQVGASCVIHAGVFVGRGTQIGEQCVIWPNAVIRDGCIVGSRVIIHPNAVIGADGLGFYFDQGRHNKVPHIGGVILEDDVEVGACTCIDRAKFGHTIIGRGTKIDNLVQLAHNVRVGEHCVFAGQSGLSGSTRIGSNCIFGGRAGTSDNVTIENGTQVAIVSTVTKDIPGNMTVSGFPAQEHRRELRERAALRRLPSLLSLVDDLQARVERLEASTNHQP